MATTKKETHSTSKIISFEAARSKLYDSVKERSENVIGTQIQAAREARGLSLVRLSELLSKYGISAQKTSISRWENGSTIPNAYQLLALCHALEIEDGIEYFTREPKKDDALNSEGWKKLAEYKALLIASGQFKPEPSAASSAIEYVTKKISMLPVSAGPGEFLSDECFEDVDFPASDVPENADYGIKVNGNSMEPVYHDGQIVWVQRCETLNPGEVGIFEYGGSGYLKQYEEQEPDAEVIEAFTSSDGDVRMQPVLVSYNSKYEKIVVSPHTYFRIEGRALN